MATVVPIIEYTVVYIPGCIQRGGGGGTRGFPYCADNLLEIGQVMNVLLLSARQSDSSVSDSSPLDLSECSF